MSTQPRLPVYEDVLHAADRIRTHAVRTPVLRSARLDAAAGVVAHVKAEVLQVGGSFKFRGAMNRLLQLSPAQQQAGVVAWSSGNHAQGVAAAAQRLGVKATIVMPADAPKLKIANTRDFGAEIVLYDRRTQSREQISFEIAARTGAVVVPSFDDPDIIAGQGSLGIELLDQVATAGGRLDALLVCCGGGGLTAGCALALEGASPGTKVYCVEPEGYDDHARSLASGQREKADTTRESLCDALLAPMPGELTFAINQPRLAGGLVVSEAEVKAAMRFAFEVLKLTVEPGGAVALAAALAGKIPGRAQGATRGEPLQVGIVLSGGNVDPGLFAQVLNEVAA